MCIIGLILIQTIAVTEIQPL